MNRRLSTRRFAQSCEVKTPWNLYILACSTILPFSSGRDRERSDRRVRPTAAASGTAASGVRSPLDSGHPDEAGAAR